MRNYGWHQRILGSFGLWWNYDLTRGAAYTWKNLNRCARFYGFTIGMCCIGIIIFRKDHLDE